MPEALPVCVVPVVVFACGNNLPEVAFARVYRREDKVSAGAFHLPASNWTEAMPMVISCQELFSSSA
jgi:hypothetical protein